jgi:hypothetical protein
VCICVCSQATWWIFICGELCGGGVIQGRLELGVMWLTRYSFALLLPW